jgi:hypothetical protein
MLTTTAAPLSRSGGRLSRRNASTPGFCSPIALTRPLDPTSWGGSPPGAPPGHRPGHGPPSAPRSPYARGRPVPPHRTRSGRGVGPVGHASASSRAGSPGTPARRRRRDDVGCTVVVQHGHRHRGTDLWRRSVAARAQLTGDVRSGHGSATNRCVSSRPLRRPRRSPRVTGARGRPGATATRPARAPSAASGSSTCASSAPPSTSRTPHRVLAAARPGGPAPRRRTPRRRAGSEPGLEEGERSTERAGDGRPRADRKRGECAAAARLDHDFDDGTVAAHRPYPVDPERASGQMAVPPTRRGACRAATALAGRPG